MTQASLSDHPSSQGLLGAGDIRRIAASIDKTPTKKWGQNFVIDPKTVERITRISNVSADSQVIEVGPGLGSLSLAILATGAHLTAIEIDPVLANQLDQTVAHYMPDASSRLHVIHSDALKVSREDLRNMPSDQPFTLVANLPYNVATPIVLTLLERFENLASFVVMVQKEVADRLTAQPGSKIYGAPSVKLAWYGVAQRAGLVSRSVFWPVPNVDSALVSFDRQNRFDDSLRSLTFSMIDQAFSQRRKTLQSALRGVVDAEAFEQAQIDPARRGETLTIDEFVRLVQHVQ